MNYDVCVLPQVYDVAVETPLTLMGRSVFSAFFIVSYGCMYAGSACRGITEDLSLFFVVRWLETRLFDRCIMDQVRSRRMRGYACFLLPADEEQGT